MFVKIKKIRRGYYEVENELITDNSKVCPKFEITEKGNAILEKLIVENPQYWLWTHRKWKHKRSEIEQKKIC
jgi:KDO2-lipid IV(A) lauroyltransferase